MHEILQIHFTLSGEEIMGCIFKTLCLFFFLRDENVASQELLNSLNL